MEHEKFEQMTAYEEMAIELEQTEMLMILLMEEIEGMLRAQKQKESWQAVACCRRANIHQSIAMHVFEDIKAVRNRLEGMVDYGS